MDVKEAQQIAAYPVQFPGGELTAFPKKGYGACDKEQWQNRQAAEAWRSQVSLLELDVVAATSIGIAAGAQVEWLGTKGQGEEGATQNGYPADYVLTVSETDLDREGSAVVDDDLNFIIYAIGFAVHRPFIMDASDGTAPIAIEPANRWLDDYADRIRARLMIAMGVTMNWPDTKCEYDLSLLKDWPVHNDVGASNAGVMTNRNGFYGINPLKTPIAAGFRTSKNLISIKATAGFAYSILNNAAFPIPTLGEDQTVVVPIECKTYGVQVQRDRCAELLACFSTK